MKPVVAIGVAFFAAAAGAWFVLRPGPDVDVGHSIDRPAHSETAPDPKPSLAPTAKPAGTAAPAVARAATKGACEIRGVVTRGAAAVAAEISVWGVARTESGGGPVPIAALVGPFLEARRAPVASAQAGADGKFAIGDLAAGTYGVVATASDGATGHALATLRTDGERATVTCRVPAGTHALRGRVLAADGSAWRGLVAAGPLVDAVDEFLADAASALTAEDGTFVIAGLTEGRRALAAVDGNGVVAATLVAVPSGGFVELRVGPGLLSLRGRVTSAVDGAPVPNALVESVHPAGLGFASTRTDADGTFLALAPPGTVLRVTAAGFAPHAEDVWYPLNLSEGVRRFAGRLFGKDEGPSTEVRLQPGAAVSGRVRTRDGKGVPGVTVTACPVGVDPDVARFSASASVSGEGGAYELREAPTGDCVLFAWGSGWISPGAGAGDTSGYLAYARRIDAGVPTVVDLLVVPTSSVEGRVVGLDQRPVPGVRVRTRFAEERNRADPAHAFLADARESASDAEGRFRFDDVVPDVPRRVEVNPGDGTAALQVVVPRSGGVAAVTLVIGPRRRLVVRVLAEEDDAPIRAAHVYVFDPESFERDGFQSHGEKRTDDTGTAVFEGLSFTAKEAGIYPEGRRGRNFAIPPSDGGETTLVVRVGLGLVLEGRVVRADGAPAPNANVWARSLAGFSSGRADGDGRFRLEGVGPGPLEVTSSDGAGTGVVRTEAGRPDVRIVLRGGPPEAPLTRVVRVVGSDGRDVPGAKLQIFDRDLDAVHLGVLVDAGDRTPIFVGEGSYAIAMHDGRSGVEGPTSTSGAEIVVRIAPSPKVAGVVVDESGAPVEGALVEVLPRFGGRTARDGGQRLRTDARGGFGFDAVAGVEVEIGVTGPPDLGAVPGATVRPPAGDLRFVLPKARVVVGRLVDATGASVAGGVVWTGSRGALKRDWRTARVERDGSFRVERAPATAFALRAGAPGWSWEEAEPTQVDVGPGTSEVVVTVPLAGALVVRVDGAGDAMGRHAHLSRPDGPARGARSARMADGVARFEAVPAGAYAFWLGPLDDGRFAFARDLRPGAKEHRLALSTGGSVRGRLVGFSPDAAHALVRIAGPEVFAQALVDAEGRFEIGGLPPGAWKVEAHVQTGETTLRGEATIATGATGDIELKAP